MLLRLLAGTIRRFVGAAQRISMAGPAKPRHSKRRRQQKLLLQQNQQHQLCYRKHPWSQNSSSGPSRATKPCCRPALFLHNLSNLRVHSCINSGCLCTFEEKDIYIYMSLHTGRAHRYMFACTQSYIFLPYVEVNLFCINISAALQEQRRSRKTNRQCGTQLLRFGCPLLSGHFPP